VEWTGFIWFRIDDDIKMDVRGLGWGEMDWIYLA
jgi:hypothetical protein